MYKLTVYQTNKYSHEMTFKFDDIAQMMAVMQCLMDKAEYPTKFEVERVGGDKLELVSEIEGQTNIYDFQED